MNLNFLKNFAPGYKTNVLMGFALLVGLVQHFNGPLPEIDPAVWNIALPLVGLFLSKITKRESK